MDNSTGAVANNVEENDWLLAAYISIVNGGLFSFDITVTVNGAIIAGLLVPAKEYMTELGALFETNGIPMAEAMKLVTDSIYPERNTDGDKDGATQRIGYMHLKNVYVISGNVSGTANSSEFPYWRIRLSQVGAWTMGKMRRD